MYYKKLVKDWIMSNTQDTITGDVLSKKYQDLQVILSRCADMCFGSATASDIGVLFLDLLWVTCHKNISSV